MLTKEQMPKSTAIASVGMATISNVSNLTSDRIKALTGGHGMVNMAMHTVANSITEDLLRGMSLSIEFADSKRMPVADVIEKAIKVAKASGADGANAALIVASMMYMAGSKAQVGIPAGNRKLGATCRMLAGVDRSGVAAVPTAKMNSKISGFPAVLAINQAMLEGTLTSFDGRKLPPNVGGGPLYGHSALGEDFIWPEMATNGARIGTQAMLDAMAGAGMSPHPFTAAVLGSAAILEIIHPDAMVPEADGEYNLTTSVYLVGKSAVKTAGLPEKLHMKVTGEEFDTAVLIGDLGLIIKDIGGPSVIGMMAFSEIFSCFDEMIAGFSGTPFNAPIGHIGTYAVIAMKALLAHSGEKDKVAKVAEMIAAERVVTNMDPDSSMIAINTISRKADELHTGIVTQTLIEATDPHRAAAIIKRAAYAYDELHEGTSLETVVTKLEEERIERVLSNASRLLKAMTGKDIQLEITALRSGARRTHKLAVKYLSFDPYVDINVTIDGQRYEMQDFVADLLPKIVRGERADLFEPAAYAAMVMDEFTLASVSIIDVVVPAAMAAVLQIYNGNDAAKTANGISMLAAAIPGAKPRAQAVAELAIRMSETALKMQG